MALLVETHGMTPMIATRVAGPEDLPAVLSIHAAHNPGMRGIGPPSPEERSTWDRMMDNAELTVYLSEIDGEPVGTATAMVMPNVTYGCAPTVFIEAVVVVPEYRRRGVASQVLRRILDDAAASGCDKVQLLSHKRHATDGGHALYAQHGFTAEAEGFRLYPRAPSRRTDRPLRNAVPL